MFPQGIGFSIGVGASNSPGGGMLLSLVGQWRRLTDGLGASGETISGSMSSTLMINPAYAADSGTYFVIVSNPYARTNSRYSFVTVGVAPNNLVVSPASTNGLVGSNVTLTVSASGTLPLSYHWFKNMTMPLASGGRVTGATSNKLTLSALALADTGSYSVVVTNAFGKATSMVAVLIVRQGPIINTQPLATVSIIQGQPLKLKVVATGSALSYQWTTNNVNLNDGPGSISGSATSNLVINPASTNDSGTYTVVVSNSIASVTSHVSIVTVKVDTSKPSVTIIRPPANARTNAAADDPRHGFGERPRRLCADHQCLLLDYQYERLGQRATDARPGGLGRRDRLGVELDGQLPFARLFACARLERLRGAMQRFFGQHLRRRFIALLLEIAGPVDRDHQQTQRKRQWQGAGNRLYRR